MTDQLGTSSELNGSHTFTRINPVAGVTFKLTPTVATYAGYSEGNRAPTPLELGCSNPSKPCLLEGFLVSDPPLKQVVSRTYEAGLRGNTPVPEGRLDWKFGLFRTDGINDIINVASAIQGRGVFQNVSATRRQGVEASVQVKSGQWLAYAAYSLTDATYQFTGNIASPNNPSADADGNVAVVPGKRIPGIPQHLLKTSIEYAATSDWRIGGNVTVVGSQYYVGDDGNQNAKLPAYWVVNLYTSYQLSKEVQLFALANNVLDQRYSTYGTYFMPQAVANAISSPLTDARTQTPAQPLSLYAGMRIRL
jgi:iron complex outermembrane receptor protein